MDLNDITVMVITDGRGDCLDRMVDSVSTYTMWPLMFDRHLINDSLEPGYADYLDRRYRSEFVVHHVALEAGAKQGFGGAIQAGWSRIEGHGGFVFHLEDDFTFTRTVPLLAMCDVLAANEDLAQVCLVRQPWNDDERAAGGIVAQHPGDYRIERDGEHSWLRHRRCFSTNPCLYRADIMAKGWPDGPHSEGVFTHRLLAEGYDFAYWGDGSEWVHHIGTDRVGVGY